MEEDTEGYFEAVTVAEVVIHYSVQVLILEYGRIAIVIALAKGCTDASSKQG